VLEGSDPGVEALAFSRDGKLLAGSILSPGQVAVWDFATGREVLAYPAAVDRLVGFGFSPDGTRLAVAANELLEVWEVDERRQRAEAARRLQAEQWRVAWHRQQAEETGDGFAVRFHRSWLIALEPNEGAHHGARADANAELGRWDEAAADAARALELGPDDMRAWHRQAVLDLHAGNVAAYRATCTRMLQRHGRTKDPDVANSVAWNCILAPGATADAEHVVRLAESAVAADARWNRLGTLGAALYRAGRPEQAVTRLREAIKAHGREGIFENWFFLALANHHLSRPDEARQCLEKALQKGENEAGAWPARVERDLLRAEVEGVLKGTRP
jgi:tetratricopeptide (TPR) repeat protein